MKTKVGTELACGALVFLGITQHSPATGVTGYWDFARGSLQGEIGPPIEYLDGPKGTTAGATVFGSTMKFGIAAIGGSETKVMQFPEMKSPTMGYVVTHGAKPNGEGDRVNQYTIIMDLLYPKASSGAFRCLLQTELHGPGEFYVNPANAVGTVGDYAGDLRPDAWHRLILAVNLSPPSPSVSKYIDGVKVAQQVLGDGIDGRWSLGPTLHLFTDPEDESRLGYLKALQIRDRALGEGEIRLLGGASPLGIPTNDLPDHPFVDSIRPAPDGFNLSPNAIIEVDIVDGQQSLERGTIRLTLNGAPVVPGISRVGRRTTVRYRPEMPLPATTNRAKVSFGARDQSLSQDWSFVVGDRDVKPAIGGQWDFDDGDLRATVGARLEYFNEASRAAAKIGSTASFRIDGINGTNAGVLRFDGAVPNVGLRMLPGAAPNGGEGVTRVNQWSVVMDLMLPNAQHETWLALLQTDPGNTSDGDLFVSFNGELGGLGTQGNYQGEGGITPGRWHRIVVAVSGADHLMEKYIDGVYFGTQELARSDLDGRYSLGSTCLLFADENGESQLAYFNSVQIRNYRMTADEAQALGGPSAAGIPQTEPRP